MTRRLIDQLRDGLAVRAPAMIVTIYGDVVVPRGGILWMGTLIEICERLGLGESLVRTAVSRLVAAGQLTGERIGRRSYYRLAETARQEFSEAARLLYGQVEEPQGWTIRYCPQGMEDVVRRHRAFASLGSDLFIAPAHDGLADETFAANALRFHADCMAGQESLPDWAAKLWPLAEYAEGYRDMIARFSPLKAALSTETKLNAADALVARLLLVHVYRRILLRDPRLPRVALHDDWPGIEAAQLFRTLYISLSHDADTFIGQHFEGDNGFLPAETAQTRARLHQ